MTAPIVASACRANPNVHFSVLSTPLFEPFFEPQTQLPETYRPSSPEEIGWGKDRDAHILSLDDRTGWSWNVRFSSPDDEAIYGLGQHQSEEMNYKGRNEELFQYNTKVSVPFVVSTAGYGLLWDSYSYGRWGNPSGYRQLGDIFRLYDRDGNTLLKNPFPQKHI